VPRVVFYFRGGRAELLGRIAAGRSPREFLYGLDAFQSAGWETSIAEAAPGDDRWIRPLVRPVETLAGKFLGGSFGLSNPLVHAKATRRADVIVSTTDGNTLPLLALKKFGLLKPPVIAITQGLFESVDRLSRRPWGAAGIRCLDALLGQASSLVVLGEGDEREVRRVFQRAALPPITSICFGADEEFWHPSEAPSDGAILSVGTDQLRDYPTLLKAAPDLPVRIVTRQCLPPELLGPQTVVDGGVDDPGLRTLYQRTPFVVIPVRDQPRDSGHSATVQAMACGKAVILSDTAGLWDRQLLRDGETCLLVPPENPAALREAMLRLWNDPTEAARIGLAARELVEKHWTARQFGERLVQIAAGLLG
jgi:hypothetical protein